MRFEHEGKKWTADAAAYVRLPDGTLLKVTGAADGDGNVPVATTTKKNVQDAAQATETQGEDVGSGPTPPSPTAEDETRARITALKGKWAASMADIEAKEQEAITLREALRTGIESELAEALLSLPKKKADQPHKVRLGENRYKAQQSRDKSERPTLAPVPAWWPDEGTL